MKRLGVTLLLATCFLFLGLAAMAGAPAKKAASPEVVYVCPKCMIAFDKPGKCTCGEALKPVQKSDIYYACDMCNVKSDKPGKCPECGMDMVLHVKSWEKAPTAGGQQKGT